MLRKLLILSLLLSTPTWAQDAAGPAPTVTVTPAPSATAAPAPSASPAPPASATDDFKAANQRMDAHDYAGALTLYEKALAADPNRPNILYNAGVAAFLGRQYDKSVDFFTRYRQVQPGDWRGMSKLCQALEEAGHPDQADAVATELHTLWKGGTNPDLSRQKSFVRDQFEQDGKPVFVFETFDMAAAMPEHVWDFVLVGPDQKPVKVYYVERDTASSQVAKQTGQGNVDLHFFDLDEPHRHSSYLMLTHRPTYAESKKIMLDIMAGKHAPTTSTTH